MEQYFNKETKWSNDKIEKCADPNSLFHAIVWKPEHLIKKFKVQSYNLVEITVPLNDTETFNHVDIKNYGRCYTYIPSSEILQNGIFKITIRFNTLVRVFITSPGVLGIKLTAENQFANVKSNTKIFANIDHNIYRMLDFEKRPCNNEKTYEFNKCIHEHLEHPLGSPKNTSVKMLIKQKKLSVSICHISRMVSK